MRRREFIIGSAAFWPFAALAQRRTWRIAILDTATAELNKPNLDAFKKRLRELGYVERQNLIIEYRSADGRNERLSALASELITHDPNVIVVRGTPEVVAVKNATNTIPVVMSAVGDPVSLGVAASLPPRWKYHGIEFRHH
jgi:putative tryptophan/tyrosine transport system substrate-binding protein